MDRETDCHRGCCARQISRPIAIDCCKDRETDWHIDRPPDLIKTDGYKDRETDWHIDRPPDLIKTDCYTDRETDGHRGCYTG